MRAMRLRMALSFFLIAQLSSPGAGAAGVRCEAVFSSTPTAGFSDANSFQVLRGLALSLRERGASAFEKLDEGYRVRWGADRDPGAPVGMNELLSRRYGAASRTFARGIYNGPIRFFLGGLPPKLRSEAGQILNRVWWDPEVRLTEAENQVIDRAGLREMLERQRAFGREHPAWRKAKGVTWSARQLGALFVGIMFLLTLDQERESFGNMMTTEEYSLLAETDKPIVHLLIETVPFPHLALRIGSRVFSYGVSDFSATSVARYFSHLPTQGTGDERKDGALQRAIEAATRVFGIEDRTTRFVELNLSRQEADALRRDLEMQTGKTYQNYTGLNDCSSMIFRALAKQTSFHVPPVVDAFPNAAGTWLFAERHLGSERIGKVGLVVHSKDQIAKKMVRNSWISLQEARLLISSLAVNLPARISFEAKNTEETIQWWTPENLEDIEKWKETAVRRIQGEAASLGFQTEQAARIAAIPASSERERQKADFLRRTENFFFDRRKEALEVLARPESEFFDLISAQGKLDELNRLQTEIEAPLKPVLPGD